MSGPSREGIIDRFNADAVVEQGITYSQYLAAGGNGSRVIVVPITAPPDGNNPVIVNGIGTFFLKNIPWNGNDNEIDGEFIYATVAGVGGGGGPGAVSFAVRLIR
jgi:hypothetical protein